PKRPDGADSGERCRPALRELGQHLAVLVHVAGLAALLLHRPTHHTAAIDDKRAALRRTDLNIKHTVVGTHPPVRPEIAQNDTPGALRLGKRSIAEEVIAAERQ